jgi:phosphoadenosine phosphosulfate reductase
MVPRKLSHEEINRLNEDFADKSPHDLLEWALQTFGNTVALSCGFGPEGMCSLDMLMKIDRKAKVFTLDTGRLPQETYDLMQRCNDKYGIKVDVYFPEQAEVEQMIKSYGVNLFYESMELRRLCCHVRKVRPLTRAMNGLHAWIAGLRKGQGVTRTEVHKLEIDEAHNHIIKINPLADWTEDQVWAYLKENQVPYNALHNRGYPSIGCAPCTRAVEPGEDVRAGRWWWELPEFRECGLHK